MQQRQYICCLFRVGSVVACDIRRECDCSWTRVPKNFSGAFEDPNAKMRMEASSCERNFDEGYLTNAISQMEQLVEKLDGSSHQDPTNPHLIPYAIETHIDSISDDESRRQSRLSPRSVITSRGPSESDSGKLTDRMWALKADLNVSKEEMRALLRSNAGLRQKNVTLTRQAQEAEGKYQSLKNRLRVVRQELHRKSSPPSPPEHKAQVPITALRNDDVAIRALRAQIESLTSNLRMKDSKIAAERDQLEVSKDHARNLESILKILEEEKRNLSESVRYLTAELEYVQQELDKRISDERESSAACAQKINSLAGDLAGVSAKLIDSQNKLNQEVKSNEELVMKLRAVNVELTKARNRSAKQERDLKDALHRAHSVDALGAKNSEELTGLQNSVRVYLNRIRKQEDRIRDLEEQVFEFQKRELVRAPVHVRKGRREDNHNESERTVPPVETLHDMT